MSSSRNRGNRKRDSKKQKQTATRPKSNTKKDDVSRSIWNKAFKGVGDGEWMKEDVAKIIYWIRQILSFIIGISWGVIRLEGILAVMLYFTVSIFALHSYKSSWCIPDDVFDIIDYFKAGLVPGVGTFLIAWIATYSLVHYD